MAAVSRRQPPRRARLAAALPPPPPLKERRRRRCRLRGAALGRGGSFCYRGDCGVTAKARGRLLMLPRLLDCASPPLAPCPASRAPAASPCRAPRAPPRRARRRRRALSGAALPLARGTKGQGRSAAENDGSGGSGLATGAREVFVAACSRRLRHTKAALSPPAVARRRQGAAAARCVPGAGGGRGACVAVCCTRGARRNDGCVANHREAADDLCGAGEEDADKMSSVALAVGIQLESS